MTDITIPPEALEAAKEAWYANHHKGTDERMTITCLAMLEAWPMKQYRAWDDVQGVGLFIILPLPQKAPSDD